MSKDRYQAKDLQKLPDRELLEKCILDKNVLEKCNTTKDFWTERFERKYGIKIENMKNTKYGKLSPYRLYLTMLQDEDILARNILKNVRKYDDRVLMEVIAKLHKSILKIGWNFNEYVINENIKKNVGIIVSKNIKTKENKEANLKLYIILNNGWPLESPNVKVLSPKSNVDKILKGDYKHVAREVLDNITIPMKQFEEFADNYFLLKLKETDSKFNYDFSSLYTKINVLPKDIMLTIMSKLDDTSLLNQCHVNKDMKRFCEDENFWRDRLVYYHGENAKSFKTKGSWKDFYLNINRYLYLAKNIINRAMILAAKEGHLDLVKFFRVKGKGANELNDGMTEAAKGGYLDIVNFFIEQGARDFNRGMEFAAEGGHRNLVDLFIEKGANKWDYGMVGAAFGGHLELVKFFRDEGAIEFDGGMFQAAAGGHLDLVKYFIEQGADNLNLKRGMKIAREKGHLNIVKFFEDEISRKNKL